MRVSANWCLPVRPFDSELVLNSDWFHTSKFGAQYGKYLPAYDVVNAQIGMNDIAGTNLSLAFSIQHLSNEKYFPAASNLFQTFSCNTVNTGDQSCERVEAKHNTRKRVMTG